MTKETEIHYAPFLVCIFDQFFQTLINVLLGSCCTACPARTIFVHDGHAYDGAAHGSRHLRDCCSLMLRHFSDGHLLLLLHLRLPASRTTVPAFALPSFALGVVQFVATPQPSPEKDESVQLE